MTAPLIGLIGATGYVGSHLLRRLLADGRRVRAIVHRDGSRLPSGVEEVRVADLLRPDLMAGALAGCDTVYHCAAIVGNLKEPFPGAYDRINRRGTKGVARAAAAARARRLVYLSGLGTRRAPRGTYMFTRHFAEESVRRSNVDHVILQPSVLFGAGAPFVDGLAGLIRYFPVVPSIGGSDLHFQPLWVEDLVTCLVQAADRPGLENRTIPLGGAEIVSFPEVIHAIAGALGKRRFTVPMPLEVAAFQARWMVRLLPRPPLTPAAVELFSFDNTTDLDAVERNFGFAPRGFREHLAAHGLS